MRRRTRLSAALAGIALICGAWALPAQARQPVVVELFTAQGCSSCVAADDVFKDLAGKPDVLALTLAVDYWDYLGWQDTFAKPEFTARQRAYMQKLAIREVYTPQVVVDGRSQAAGGDRAKVEALVAKAGHARPAPLKMTFLRRAYVQVGSARPPVGGADVWLVRYDPAVQEVQVKRGENRGETLAQRNVVRQLMRLGGWYGKSKVFAAPAAPAGETLKTVVLVQARGGGRILGVLQR